MLLLSRGPDALRESEVTPESLFLRRRELLAAAAHGTAALTGGLLLGRARPARASTEARRLAKLDTKKRMDLSGGEDLTPFDDASAYNNFYEFGTGKDDPAQNAHSLVPKPWSVRVGGEVAKPGDVPLETLLAPHALEERIYRFRCVEAWSMVIPWVGIPLAAVLERLEPSAKAKYVALRTLVDVEQMPGQRRRSLDWPYREGLRLDEAMNPLAILAVGMYGRELPNQNGAPLRLVVPWKYGFKSIKSIVSIELVKDQPETTWNQAQSSEYGFYSNVNPEVDHPRWSQASERRIGEFFKRPTLPFNGYAEQVASLYTGMDLRKNF